MKRRWPLLLVAVLGVVLWRTSYFGFAPSERTVQFELPVSYREVQGLELQVWDGERLVRRTRTELSQGLTREAASVRVPLRDGTFRAAAVVTLRGAGAPVTFQRDFEASGEAAVVDFKR